MYGLGGVADPGREAMKNEGQNLEPEILELLENLLSIEEEYEQRLKKFLEGQEENQETVTPQHE